MSNRSAAQVAPVPPRFIRAMDAPGYLGMCRDVFNKTVRPNVREFPIGKQSVGFDRIELDPWADVYIEAMAIEKTANQDSNRPRSERQPERRKQKQAQHKDHWTKVEERYLTQAFKEAREASNCYAGWKEEEMPGFHEVRALSLHLYKKAGKDGQKIAGHASEGMTKNYQRDHEEIVWSEAIPDLNISEITG
ncbi:hypothetical protein D3C84_665130 [compost metagenome]